MNQHRSDAIIIGAGAAGLACAAAAGHRGRRVDIVDHNAAAGLKIDVTGGGHCNFTNRDVEAKHYWSENGHFCKSALARYRPERILTLAGRHGIAWREKEEGRIFCCGPASQITTMLLDECALPGVALHLGVTVDAVDRDPGGDRFRVRSGETLFEAASLVVATGGLSWPRLGATSFGHDLAERFGIDVVPPRPGLVPLLYSAADRARFAPLAGCSVDAAVTCGGHSFRESVLFTHVGLSGPAILQASCCWRPGDELAIDLLPTVRIGEVIRIARESGDGRSLKTLIARRVAKRIVDTLCGDLPGTRPAAQFGRKETARIEDALHDWRIVPEETAGYDKAEVTLGGVDTRALSSKTMECRRVAGLHFVGEAVDVTGRLGGYNLHWAFASGTAAGEAV